MRLLRRLVPDLHRLYKELHLRLHKLHGLHDELHLRLHFRLHIELHVGMHLQLRKLHPGHKPVAGCPARRNRGREMKAESKKQICCALFLILFGMVLCEYASAASVSPEEWRKRADILSKKIGLCEEDKRRGAKDCLVIVNWEGNRKVSLAEARNLVSLYLREAQRPAAAPHSFVLPAWRPEEISNPQIYRIAKSLDAIKVPPPIPSADASINWNTVAQQTSGLGSAADYGMLALDLFGRIGAKHTAFKGIVIGSKTFIAGEEGALLYVARQTQTYENAMKYLKDPATSKTFAYMVRDLKERGATSIQATPDMLTAAKAVADPKVGDTRWLVWDAFLSPEARTAMLKKACLEIGTELAATGAGNMLKKVSADLEGRKAVFDAIRLERKKAVGMMRGASPADQHQLNRVIAHANKQLEWTYRTEQAGPTLMGYFAGQYAYREAEKW